MNRPTHYETLDIPTDASPSEVGNRYRALKALYGGGLGTYGLFGDNEREAQLAEVERAYFVLCDVARRKAYDQDLARQGHAGPWYEAAAQSVVPPESNMPRDAGAVQDAAETKIEIDSVGDSTLLDIEQSVEDDSEASHPGAAQAVLDLEPPNERMDGEYLRMVRELRNVPLEKLSGAIKITMTQLENIEQEKFEKLPAPVYLRGFLRSYAIQVGIDPDRLTEDYLARRAEWADDQTQS